MSAHSEPKCIYDHLSIRFDATTSFLVMWFVLTFEEQTDFKGTVFTLNYFHVFHAFFKSSQNGLKFILSFGVDVAGCGPIRSSSSHY